MSAESGVPLAPLPGSYPEFVRDPFLVLDRCSQWSADVEKCQPHEGHRRIAELVREKPDSTVVTLNVDGLHQRAGCPRVLEVHGNIKRFRCEKCGPVEGLVHRCSAAVRPDIYWPGETLDWSTVESALEALRTCDLLVTVGTSGTVEPTCCFPLEAKKARRIEINPVETVMSGHYHERWRGPASEMLLRL